MSASEFEDEIYVMASDENMDDVMKKAEKKDEPKVEEEETKTDSESEVDEDDLF